MIFDFVPGLVKFPVVGSKKLAMSSWWDARVNPMLFQRLSEFVAVISLIGDQKLRPRHGSEH
jgi:hypothetical protein